MTLGGRTAAVLVREWKATCLGEALSEGSVRAFLLGITSDELEAVSRAACRDGHPLQAEALAFLRALYAID
jgi:hypothetical protein